MFFLSIFLSSCFLFVISWSYYLSRFLSYQVFSFFHFKFFLSSGWNWNGIAELARPADERARPLFLAGWLRVFYLSFYFYFPRLFFVSFFLYYSFSFYLFLSIFFFQSYLFSFYLFCFLSIFFVFFLSFLFSFYLFCFLSIFSVSLPGNGKVWRHEPDLASNDRVCSFLFLSEFISTPRACRTYGTVL